MGRIRAFGHRRALIGVIAVAALALAACVPSNTPRPPVPPVAAFSVSTAPLVASFTDQSTGVVNTRSWDFGDSQTSTEQNPTHTYATHGLYTVSLTVTGPGGTNTAKQNVTVNPPAPAASFTSEPPSGTVPLTVFLSNTSTGLVDSIAWDLNGDGVFDDATGPTATKTFDTAGDHTVGLSVTGPGGTSTVSKVISATLPPPPLAVLTALPTSGVTPLLVSLNGCASTGDITKFEWDFNGDGIVDQTGPCTTEHTFSSPGTFGVTLLLTGPGGTNTATQTITANVPPPVAAFNSAPITGTTPLAVQFTNASTGTITSMTWDLGNNTTIAVNTPAGFGVPVGTTYDAPGTYTATLTVNGPGGTDTATRQILVTAANAAPTVMISSPESGASFQASTNVTFTGSAMDAEDGTISSSIEWTSSIIGPLGTGASISNGNLPVGTHTITASVTDTGGKKASTSITITVTGAPASTTTTTTAAPPPPPPLPIDPRPGGGREVPPNRM
jgi:PKD repeat protein